MLYTQQLIWGLTVLIMGGHTVYASSQIFEGNVKIDMGLEKSNWILSKQVLINAGGRKSLGLDGMVRSLQ